MNAVRASGYGAGRALERFPTMGSRVMARADPPDGVARLARIPMRGAPRSLPVDRLATSHGSTWAENAPVPCPRTFRWMAGSRTPAVMNSLLPPRPPKQTVATGPSVSIVPRSVPSGAGGPGGLCRARPCGSAGRSCHPRSRFAFTRIAFRFPGLDRARHARHLDGAVEGVPVPLRQVRCRAVGRSQDGHQRGGRVVGGAHRLVGKYELAQIGVPRRRVRLYRRLFGCM